MFIMHSYWYTCIVWLHSYVYGLFFSLRPVIIIIWERNKYDIVCHTYNAYGCSDQLGTTIIVGENGLLSSDQVPLQNTIMENYNFMLTSSALCLTSSWLSSSMEGSGDDGNGLHLDCGSLRSPEMCAYTSTCMYTVERLITNPPKSDHPLCNRQPLWNRLNLP